MGRNPEYGPHSAQYVAEDEVFDGQVGEGSFSDSFGASKPIPVLQEEKNSNSVEVNKVCRMVPIMWSSSLTYSGVLAIHEINNYFKQSEKEEETKSRIDFELPAFS